MLFMPRAQIYVERSWELLIRGQVVRRSGWSDRNSVIVALPRLLFLPPSTGGVSFGRPLCLKSHGAFDELTSCVPETSGLTAHAGKKLKSQTPRSITETSVRIAHAGKKLKSQTPTITRHAD